MSAVVQSVLLCAHVFRKLIEVTFSLSFRFYVYLCFIGYLYRDVLDIKTR